MLTVFNVLSLANLIPFLQLDGYLLLSTYLGRPKLREEATQQFLHRVGLSKPLLRTCRDPKRFALATSRMASSLFL